MGVVAPGEKKYGMSMMYRMKGRTEIRREPLQLSCHDRAMPLSDRKSETTVSRDRLVLFSSGEGEDEEVQHAWKIVDLYGNEGRNNNGAKTIPLTSLARSSF